MEQAGCTRLVSPAASLPITCFSYRPVLLGQWVQIRISNENMLWSKLSQSLRFFCWVPYWDSKEQWFCLLDAATRQKQSLLSIVGVAGCWKPIGWIWCWITAILADIWAFSPVFSVLSQLKRHCESSQRGQVSFQWETSAESQFLLCLEAPLMLSSSLYLFTINIY